MTRAMLAFSLAIRAGAAGAQELESSAVSNCDQGDAAGTPFALEGYTYSVFDGGFVSYEAYEPASDSFAYVLEYCPERRQLVLRRGGPGADAVAEAGALAMMDEMIFGSEGYTMSEMARRLRAIGAEAEVRTVSYESCACKIQ